MKKIVILSIAMIGMFASCKKSSSSTPTGVSATIGGSNKNFSTLTAATKTNLGGFDEIVIMGEVASGTTASTIDITIANDLGGGVDSIVAGTYADSSTKFSVSVDYLTSSGSLPLPYSGGTNVDGSQSPASVPNHLVVTISSITSTSIKGTFTGNLYLGGDATSTALAVTNGSFNLPLKQQ